MGTEKTMTYKQAHNIIMEALQSRGWVVKRRHNGHLMRIPHATDPSGHIRLWFKSQAVYRSRPNQPLKLKYALSLFAEDTTEVKRWAQEILREGL